MQHEVPVTWFAISAVPLISSSSIFNQGKKIKFQQGGYATRIQNSPSVHSSLLKWYFICQSYSYRCYNSSTGMVVSFFLHSSEIGKNPDNWPSSLFSGLLCKFFLKNMVVIGKGKMSTPSLFDRDITKAYTFHKFSWIWAKLVYDRKDGLKSLTISHSERFGFSFLEPWSEKRGDPSRIRLENTRAQTPL